MSNLILKRGISETHSYHKYDLIKGIKALKQNGLISEDKINELRNALYNQVDWEWDDVEALLPQNISYEVRYINKIIYDLENILNQDEILFETNKIGGIEAIDKLIELSKDKDIAEQILSAVGEYGAKNVLEILLGGKVKIDEKEVIKDNEPYNVSIKPKDAPILEAITKIEAFIGKENLSQIIGFYQYVSAALSNNALSVPATKVIQIMSNLVNNLEEWLDYSSLYESADLENQVAIILTQLENWFDFVASGHTHIGLPPRYSDFDPDYDFGGGSNGGDNGKHHNSTDINNIDFSLLFIGLNLTNSEIDH